VKPVEAEIRRIIATDGPIPVGHFMALCLGHPAHGYYLTRDPFGAAGDFITAPEISQMFGELIGLWAAAVWRQMGAPDTIRLVELGPGRGTLMADALRAAKVVPDFRAALRVDLVETSPVLRGRQQQTLAGGGVPLAWHQELADVPDIPHVPLIVVANEFVDALPVDQVVRAADGWHQRMVGTGADGRLAFALHPEPLRDAGAIVPEHLRDAPVGALFEWRSDRLVTELARRVVRSGGAALVIDYGHLESAIGETLQAVMRHDFVDVLQTPGEADLTAHVDFSALSRAAGRAGAEVHGPLAQGEFLRRLGIGARAARLAERAAAAQAAPIQAAVRRLTGSGRDDMGELFKAMAVAAPGLGPLPGLA
jgi:SAM-dependent MidA family methyltransferase